MLTKDYSAEPEALHGRPLFKGPQRILINGEYREVGTYYKEDVNGRLYPAGERDVRRHVKATETNMIRIKPGSALYAKRMAHKAECDRIKAAGHREPDACSRLIKAIFGVR